ncbi:hypothetical protein NQ318_006196 [Aromia moschata]|uniref:G-protein coupled receptors family 1 profile domain-containing protein n=1 Tax=Aromia moschata TaxID=1265417 RepID=A0AAV8YG58_9CUCU|nr:hypothetical protein NQ318_006196 [Aromia moschata]
MKGEHFGSVKNIQKACTDALKAIPENDYRADFDAWKTRWNRCVDAGGMMWFTTEQIYIAVTQPIKYAKHKNTRRVWLTVALVWMISAAIGSPIVLGLNNTPDRVADACLFYNSDFVIYSSLSSFYIPCIIMVFLYYNIFKNENISRRTIYRTIAECVQGIPCLNLPKKWKTTSIYCTEGRAVEYGIVAIEEEWSEISKKTCPKYTQGQLLRIPRCCRQLRRVYFADGKSIILDDEKYFTLANSEMKGNDGIYTNNLEECPDNVKFKTKAKFADKILVWCAISNRGISRPFVGRVRGEALNSQGYIESCLSKLLQIVQEHHAEDDIMFWPDLASCRYSRDTQNWLRQHRIPFVPKNANPPNLPQTRPIEDFWALLSWKLSIKM